jgi:AcrR family transcriptional regulator
MAAPAPLRRSQKDRNELSRATIINAGFICFGQYGYQQTTLAKIAFIAQCSKELPRYHFESKDNLIKILLDITLNDWQFQLTKPTNNNLRGLDALIAATDAFAAKYANDSSIMRGQLALIFGAADPSNSELREMVASTQKNLRQSFQKIIEDSYKTSNSPPSIDAGALAALLHATFRGIGYQWMTDSNDKDIQKLFSEFKLIMKQLLPTQ